MCEKECKLVGMCESKSDTCNLQNALLCFHCKMVTRKRQNFALQVHTYVAYLFWTRRRSTLPYIFVHNTVRKSSITNMATLENFEVMSSHLTKCDKFNVYIICSYVSTYRSEIK
jgi:hypothetical protein